MYVFVSEPRYHFNGWESFIELPHFRVYVRHPSLYG
jgi:hypothetical protein